MGEENDLLLNDINSNSDEKDLLLSDIVQNSMAVDYDQYFSSPIELVGETGLGKSMFDENVPFTMLDDLNEIRAQRQPWAYKFGAGVGRVGTKVASEISKMPGVLGGIVAGGIGQVGDLISGEDNTDFMKTAFDNPWINAIQDIEDKVKEDVLPVYVKKAVSEGNLWDNITSIDFWATEGADGLGYIASMLAPGAAITKFNIGAKLLQVDKLTKMFKATERGRQTINALGINAKNANVYTATVANTLFEAGAEAKGAMDSYEMHLQQALEKGEISQEEYSEKIVLSSKVGANVFGANAMILLGPNLIMSKMLWGGPRNKTPNKITNKNGKLEYQNLDTKQRINIGGQDFAKAGAREGFFEEGMQSTAEKYFTSNPDKSLGDFIGGDFAAAYLENLQTTDGQKAIFLGMAFGGGMQAYQGYNETSKENKIYNQLAKQGNETLESFYDLLQDDIYKKDDETGNVIYTQNENGEDVPEIDPLKLVKKLQSFTKIETLSDAYDLALIQGDVETLKDLQDIAITNLIKGFAFNESLGLDTLREHLETTKKLDGIPQEIIGNKSDFINKVMEKAKFIQKEFSLIENFSDSLYDFNESSLSSEHKTRFVNKRINEYVDLKAQQYDLQQKIKRVEESKQDIIASKGIDSTIYSENQRLENELLSKDKRLRDLKDNEITLDQADKSLKKQIDEYFSDETLENSLKKYEKEYKEAEEALKKENEVKEVLDKIKNAKTQEELDDIKSPMPESDIAVGEAKSKKSNELAEKAAQEAEQIKDSNEQYAANENPDATEKDAQSTSKTEPNNNPEDKGIYQTEGNLDTPYQEVEEEDTSGNKFVSASQPRIIVTDNNKGAQKLPFVSDAALEFERTPRDKSQDKPKSLEINTNRDGLSANNKKAIEMYENNDISDLEFLIDHLPINVILAENTKAPLETKPNKGSVKVFNETSRPLRTTIVKEIMINKVDPSNIGVKIDGQWNGEIQLDGNNENAVQDLYDFDGKISNVKSDDIFVVDDTNQLVNIKGEYLNHSGRKLAKGEVYIRVKTAAGRDFPLKLNIAKVTEAQADLLYDIYAYRFTNREGGKAIKLKDLPQDIQDKINNVLSKEIELFNNSKKPYNSLTLKDIIDLLIYDGSGVNNKKSRIRFYKDNLLIGNGQLNEEDFNSEKGKSKFIEFLVNKKRRNIRFKRRKSESTNNPSLESRNYLEYLLDNKILNTNAKVKQHLFSGKTTMYLAKDGVVVNGKLSEFNKDVPIVYESNLYGSNTKLHKVLPEMASNPVELNESGTKYVDKQGNEYSRVSTLKDKDPNLDKINVYNAAKRGDVTDELLRLFFTKNISEQEFMKYGKDILNEVNKIKNKSTISISDSYFKDLFNILTVYKNEFNRRKYTIYANTNPLKGRLGTSGNFAGTMDLLAYDNTNKEWIIIDLKTSTVDRNDYYSGKAKDIYGYIQKDLIQQNAYKELFNQVNDISPSKLLILPLIAKGDTKSNDAYSEIKLSSGELFIEVDSSKSIYDITGIKEKYEKSKINVNKFNEEVTNVNFVPEDVNEDVPEGSVEDVNKMMDKFGIKLEPKKDSTPKKSVPTKKPTITSKKSVNVYEFTAEEKAAFSNDFSQASSIEFKFEGKDYIYGIGSGILASENGFVNTLEETVRVIENGYNKGKSGKFAINTENIKNSWKSRQNNVSLQKSESYDYNKLTDEQANKAVLILMRSNPAHIKDINKVLSQYDSVKDKLENLINFLVSKGQAREDIITKCNI